jgi:hypothetical protein
LKRIKEILITLGGWPVISENWDEASWTWQKTVKDLEVKGFPTNYIFEISISPDQKNTSRRTLGVRRKEKLFESFLKALKIYYFLIDISSSINRH